MQPTQETPIQTRLVRWFSLADAETAAPVVSAVAEKIMPELVRLLTNSLSLPHGTSLTISQSERETVARQVVLELIASALDPELVRTDFGVGFRKHLTSVAAKLNLPTTEWKWREARSEDLDRWFSDALPSF